ncbi:MAG: glycosyltransferase family 2 protein [Paracoccus sp. (in: a-proteobacteria)]|uniref:glycosyltransferase family 2 protein n=1 Tax=Paracoccus sp. TaxID=267 RepID=UPI0026E07449|nr:glycosyltransferase family 2 protein [Paracoccus sp. (in: a-proteobacteria)]MDO5620909.1 glycosyltransferase family 2 protein [Paracoccus sp. (in: a-proteobacteria)]
MPDQTRFLALATVKNEGAFLLEWLAWHRLIGFTDFLVFQNGSVDGTKELLALLAEHGLITYHDNDGIRFRSPQRHSYRQASQSDLFRQVDWAIAIDADEFIRIDVPGGTLPDLIAAYPDDAEEIRLNWHNFGHSQQYTLESDLVVSRFTHCLPEDIRRKNRIPTKTIFRPTSFARFGVHSPKSHVAPTWHSYDGSANRIESPETLAVGHHDPEAGRLASVHHYIVKDTENFVLKCDRGKSGHVNRDMKELYWRNWNARGGIDTTMAAQAGRIAEEIQRIDAICGGQALKIQQAAMVWRHERYAQLMGDPEYAIITKEILEYENQPVPEAIARVASQLPSPEQPAPALPDTPPAAVAEPAGPNLDFSLMREMAQTQGGEFHETEHHVVVHIPGRDRLVFGFDNLSSMGVPGPRKPWAFDLIRAQGWGALGVMVKRNDWFRSDALFDVLEDMRDRGIYASYPAVSMYGASMGAFGAAAFAPLAPGCTVLAFAPQSSLAADLVPFERRYRYARRPEWWALPRYRDAAEGIKAAGKAIIVHDPLIGADKAHAERLLGDNGVDLRWPFLTHKIPPRFKLMKILKDIALEGMAGRLDRARFCELMRARRDCNAYLVDMLSGAAQRGHTKLAQAALKQARNHKDNWKLRQLERSIRRQVSETESVGN